MLNGAITALVTPLTDTGAIDYAAIDRLIELQIAGGVSGIVVVGATGESTNLEMDEKFEVIKYVLKRINKRIKVIVGANYCGTDLAIKCFESLNQLDGIDYIMVVAPPYVKPTQEGLYQHFATLAKLSKSPIILYNVPGRTSCDLHDATTLRLANDFPNIVGLKDATGDIARCCHILKYKPPGFMLFTGNDDTALAYTLCGGNGVISVVSNLLPIQVSRMIKYAQQGDMKQAITLNNQILDIHRLMFIEANPIPVKWALYHANIIDSPKCRLPLTTLTNANQEVIKPFLLNAMNGENKCSSAE